MKRIACCQPHYIPWIGYFEMIDRVDEFWFFDDVDFIKREWKNRNRIRKERTSSETKWLSVPIERSSQRGTALHRARIAVGEPWRKRHMDAFRHVYRDAPHFTDARDLLRRGLERPAETLADLNVGLVEDIADYLGIETRLGRTSTLGVGGRKTERLVEVCRATAATSYLANNGSATYLEPERFAAASIELAYQDYAHPTYEQRSGEQPLPFLSHLSVLDLIANAGEASLAILREGAPAGVR